jgi:hypothetical protein
MRPGLSSWDWGIGMAEAVQNLSGKKLQVLDLIYLSRTLFDNFIEISIS